MNYFNRKIAMDAGLKESIVYEVLLAMGASEKEVYTSAKTISEICPFIGSKSAVNNYLHTLASRGWIDLMSEPSTRLGTIVKIIKRTEHE